MKKSRGDMSIYNKGPALRGWGRRLWESNIPAELWKGRQELAGTRKGGWRGKGRAFKAEKTAGARPWGCKEVVS